jgi:COMPASS component SWD3
MKPKENLRMHEYRKIKKITGIENKIACLRFSPDMSMIASGLTDSTVRVWNLNSPGYRLECIRILKGHKLGVNDIAWQPRCMIGKSCYQLVSASDDQTLIYWNTKKDYPVSILTGGHTHCVRCCEWSPRGNIVASGSYDETIVFWSTSDHGTKIRVIPAHSDPVTGLSFSFDGSMLASSSTDGMCRVWKVDTGHCISTTFVNGIGLLSAISNAIFLSNPNFIALATMDGYLRLYDRKLKKFRRLIGGVKNRTHFLHFAVAQPSIHETFLFYVYEGDSISLWNIACYSSKISDRYSKTKVKVAYETVVVALEAKKRMLAIGISENDDSCIEIWLHN